MSELAGAPAARIVERVDWDWESRQASDSDYAHDDARYGEQLEWGAAIPMVYQSLSAPDLPARMIHLTRRSAPAYWGSLLHILLYSFGWSNPAKGFSRWYFRERLRSSSVEDARLELISAVWLADGYLEEFLAQLVRMTGPEGLLAWRFPSVVRQGAPPRGLLEAQPSIEELVPEGFVEHAEAAAERRGPDDAIWSPLSGGSDPLHLGSHIEGPLQNLGVDERTRERFVVDEGAGRAVIQLDRMVGWYYVLAVLGSELPDRGGRSWKVDVHVATVGHLGTFRRSRETGLWFNGRHRYHVWGNG